MKVKYLLLTLLLALILTGCGNKKIDLVEEGPFVLQVGEEKTINYNVLGSKEDTYLKASVEDIIIIEGNKIVAVSQGSLTIDICFKNSEKSFASFSVTVIEKVENKNILVDYEDFIILKTDEEMILVYEALNCDDEVVITSSNSSVVISGDKITAQKVGKAVLSFSFKGDKEIYATVNVKVIAREDIIVSEDTINLEVLDEHTLLYEVLNSDIQVILVSSNDDVIKVEGDVLKALEAGDAIISLKFFNDDMIYATVNVVVKNKPLVKEIQIDEKNISLTEKDEYIVNYTVINSDEDVILISDNLELAEIVGNKIIAKKAGEANISLKFVNDEKVYNNILVSIEELPKSIIISNQEIELSLLTTLQITLELENVSEVIYEINNLDIASISSEGLITPIKEGEFILYVRDANDEAVSASIALSVMMDPFIILDMAHVERPITQYVSSYGYNPDIRYQWVYGSVSLYSTMNLNLVENIVPITDNPYKKTTATPEKLAIAEPMKLVRSGILHEKTEFITYHDTGNHTPGANAQMHANYMVGQDNTNNRARSWHYTVDQNQVIHHIPDNEVSWQGDSYTAYARSIGVETCVDFGSDLYTTWQRTGKLMAKLIVDNNLGLSAVKQHYDWNQKNCPQTLRMNNLYKVATGMIEAEYNVLTYLKGFNIEFVSLNPEYVDNTGKIIKLPSKPMRVGYKAVVTSPTGKVSEKIYYSYLKLQDGSTLTPSLNDIEVANNFDSKVWNIKEINFSVIDPLIEQYQAFTEEVKDLVLSYSLLQSLEIGLMQPNALETPVVIYEIHPDNSMSDGFNSYIMLYNMTKADFSLKDKYLIIYNNTTSYSLEGMKEGKDWYKFNDDAVIKGSGFYLIQTSNITGGKDLPLADAAVDLDVSSNFVLVFADELKDFSKKQDIVIDLVITNQDANILNPVKFDIANKALKRKYLLDTNNCVRDFVMANPNPINSSNKGISDFTVDEKQALLVDTLIRFLDRKLMLSDEEDISNLIELYDNLTLDQKNLIKLKNLYNVILMRWAVVSNPDLKVISDAVEKIPNQIINDFTLPMHEGLVYSYGVDQDSSHFDLQTGKYIKISYEYKPVIITLTYKDIVYDIVVNFGVAKDNEIVVYATGPKTTGDDGATASGSGTYENQLNSIGFGDIAIKVDGKVYIIGHKSYIQVNGTCIMNQLGIAELRPYGSAADAGILYNQGLIKGVPTGYMGTGALYENISDAELYLDPSNTYGRNNAGVYGYAKVIFSLNADGTYLVSKIVPNSGTNDNTNGDKIKLNPSDILWAPHTYETNVKGGTWLMSGGTGGSVGVLAEGKIIEVVKFNR